jgi:hypothetical protein
MLNSKPPVPHYDRCRVQPIDMIESWFSQKEFDGYSGYLAGNVIKYLCRYPFKGKPTEDLNKAKIYLQWLCDYVDTNRT